MGDPLIIESPELQQRRQRLLFGLLTFVLWVGWTYLWLPIVSLIEWLFDIPANYQAFVLNGYAALAEVAVWYLCIVALMGGSLIAWAIYNLVRFRGVDRRQPREPLDAATLASYHEVEHHALHDWQRSRRLLLEHDPNGRIANVEIAVQA